MNITRLVAAFFAAFLLSTLFIFSPVLYERPNAWGYALAVFDCILIVWNIISATGSWGAIFGGEK